MPTYSVVYDYKGDLNLPIRAEATPQALPVAPQ